MRNAERGTRNMAEDAEARGELEPLGAARLRAAGNKRPAHAHAAAWAPRLDLLALGVTTVPPGIGGKGLAAEARPTLAVLRLKEAQEVWAEVSEPADPARDAIPPPASG